ncbi:MAG: sulfoxide reductase heme-binding subunit YedZ [Anaerolineales bacterium]|nr:sulfoxide reductase heme-binding subunit YedZ [Anaerolineales bacterium]MDW8226996.1 protein-methionine-sulfoxide reductase heme-binding subunit MsrQ [Anaerolineales bacterium]
MSDITLANEQMDTLHQKKTQDFWRKGSWLRWIVHLLGVWPLAALGWDAWQGNLSVNPIQDAEQRLGRAALYFLVASLAVTPLTTLTGWHFLPPRRRALGLYAFLYASLHFAVFVALDYGFDIPEIFRLTREKPFILLGLTAGLLLLPLAITSFDHLMRRMGKRWKRLHRLIYLIAPMVILHYAWAQKGDFFALRGDILRPLLWGIVLIVLFVLRLPVVRRKLSAMRQKVSSVKSV